MEPFVSTPSSSDVDFFIEKFCVEIGRTDDENNIGTRTLTLTSPVKAGTEVNNNIDKQITDLENLIKKLQDEIVEMISNADNEVEEYTPIYDEDSAEVRRDLSNETIILDNECDNVNETENVRESMKGNNSEKISDSERYSHVYPLTIRDRIFPFTGGNQTPGHVVTDLMHTNADKTFTDQIDTIKQDFIHLWDDLPKYTPNENLEGLIDELKSEITENIEPTDKFEDAY